jgi:D-aminoacyl-tRNA deacylase
LICNPVFWLEVCALKVMQSILQRVSEAHVVVSGQRIAAIEHGLLVLFCAEQGDTQELADKMLSKILKLRIFNDAQGKMNRSLQEVAGGLLVVSQFTLAADVSGGNRPGFTQAAPPDLGRSLYDYFVARARAAHSVVATGQFAADMQVYLVNDGPVTVPLKMRA